MQESDRMYMLFTAAGIYFLIPLFWVKSVISGEKDIENLPVLDFVSLAGGDDSVYRQYQLELAEGQRRFVIRVESVVGIQEVSEEQIRRVPAAVMNSGNRYLSKVIRMTTEDMQDYPAYIINPEEVRKMAEQCGGEAKKNEVYNS